MDLNWLLKKINTGPLHWRIKSFYELTGEAMETGA